MSASRSSLILGAALWLALGACKGNPPAPPADTASAAPAASEPAPIAESVDKPAMTAEPAAMPEPTASATATSAGSGWQYQKLAKDGGTVLRAELASTSGNERLVFENDPVTGRDLRLQARSVQCPELNCRSQIRVDGAAAINNFTTQRDATTLQLSEPRDLWNALRGAQTLSIDYPTATGSANAQFDVNGVDLSQLPGWEQ